PTAVIPTPTPVPTTQPVIDNQAPSIPTNLSATVVSSSQINLSWSASTDNVGVTGYKIYRGGTLLTTINATSYSNTGLNASTQYDYSVSAYDAMANESSKSVSVKATTTKNVSGDIISNLNSAKRLTSWNNHVGVPGGIPNRTTKCISVSCLALQNASQDYKNGSKDAQLLIQNAIDSAPENSYVLIPEGIFLLNQPVSFNDKKTIKNITIKGSGPSKTVLIPKGWTAITSGSNNLSSERKVLSGSNKGSNSIIVSDSSGVQVGSIISLYQDNDPDFYWSRWGSKDHNGQYLMVTSVNGNTITFEDPLAWDFNKNPRFKYTLYPIVKFVGVEDLSIKPSSTYDGTMVNYVYTYGAWIKNLELVGGIGNSMVNLNMVLRSEIRDSYIHDSLSVSDGYGILTLGGWPNGAASSGLLVENNIFSGLRSAIVLEGDTGGVYSYNYARNTKFDGWPNYNIPDFNANHGEHGMMNLWEGNYSTEFQSDGYHGSASHQTLFRNYLSGKHVDPNRTGNRMVIDLTRYSYYFNLIGNILGSSEWTPTFYEMTGVPLYPQTQTIYRLGYPNMGNNGYCNNVGEYWYDSGCTTVFNSSQGNATGWLDSKVKNTLVRWGNFDYKNLSTRWNVAEVSNDVVAPSSNSIPSSLYLSSKPSWFGNLVWPPIGPDVSGKVNDIPAKYCYDRGSMPNCLVSNNSSVVNGVCSTNLNLCSQGTFQDVADTTTNNLWSCVGSNGGSTASCSLPISSTPTPVVPTPTPVVPTPTPLLPDTTSPTVSITSPSNNTTISNTVTLSSTASDPTVAGQTTSGILSVQFKLNNLNLGQLLTTAPYSGTWNTVGVTNGSHTLTAIATDVAGNTKTSNPIRVTISNTTPSTPTPTPATPTPKSPTPPPALPSTPTPTPVAPSLPTPPIQSVPTPTPTSSTPATGGGGGGGSAASPGGGSSAGGGSTPASSSNSSTGGGSSVGTFTPTVPQKPLPTTSCTQQPLLSRTLTLGSTGTDVRNLQIFLNSKGFTVSQGGPGSNGQETTYFGPATTKALAKYQQANNILPANGYLNANTLTIVNSLYTTTSKCSDTTAITTTTQGLPQSYVFTTTLKQGMTSPSVKYLQIFLNNNGYTISISGPGSKGNETTYFGPATLRALIKFQEYYAKDILTPSGLTSGTGYFGPATMRKVNGFVR
ncbi:peptidoglycan-binding protein, partial [Candidatus Woesebacteria bacterium]|nr:peptidoglycan-binding protein [Candidatus Woesebacteria bacterium]